MNYLERPLFLSSEATAQMFDLIFLPVYTLIAPLVADP